MNIAVNNSAPETAVVKIDGPIGFSDHGATYESFAADLEAAVSQGVALLRVEIRSTGGSVHDALLIHGALCALQGVRIETRCYGFVASAATIIAQAATAGGRYIGSTALYLVHNASTAVEGTARVASAAADLLAKTDRRIAELYADRSGLPVAGFEELMARADGVGEWLSAPETVEAGLADAVEELPTWSKAVERIKNFMTSLFDVPKTWEIEPLENESSAFFAADAPATTTLPKEDPEICSEAVDLTSNAAAYGRDVALFREL